MCSMGFEHQRLSSIDRGAFSSLRLGGSSFKPNICDILVGVFQPWLRPGGLVGIGTLVLWSNATLLWSLSPLGENKERFRACALTYRKGYSNDLPSCVHVCRQEEEGGCESKNGQNIRRARLCGPGWYVNVFVSKRTRLGLVGLTSTIPTVISRGLLRGGMWGGGL